MLTKKERKVATYAIFRLKLFNRAKRIHALRQKRMKRIYCAVRVCRYIQIHTDFKNQAQIFLPLMGYPQNTDLSLYRSIMFSGSLKNAVEQDIKNIQRLSKQGVYVNPYAYKRFTEEPDLLFIPPPPN